MLVATIGITQAQTVRGRASHVYDGDSFRLYQSDGSYIPVRLANIDAPEVKPKQAFGLQAKYFLDSLIDGKKVEIRIQATDRYARKVALVYCNGQELNQLLVANPRSGKNPQDMLTNSSNPRSGFP